MNDKKHLLIIDDDVKILDLLKQVLTPQGYLVTTGTSIGDLKKHLSSDQHFDMLLLDVMLPDGDGLDFCQGINKTYPELFTILITANKSESDRVLGIEFGADDYIEKPFNTRELEARIRAFFRRKTLLNETAKTLAKQRLTYAFNGWQLNTKSTILTDSDGAIVTLPHGAYELLTIFVKHPNTALSREFLLDATQKNTLTFDRSIDKHISRLRQKLRDDTENPQLIKTIRGIGYIFAANVTSMPS